MPEQEIYNVTKSHWDNDGDWNRAETGNGTDEHTINVPSGKLFSKYELAIIENSMGSLASVDQFPPPGATGQQKIKVKWDFKPFGKINYRLKAFASDTPVNDITEILPGSPNWDQTTINLIRQRRKVKLVVTGPDARTLVNFFRKLQNQAPLPLNQPTYSAVIGTGAVEIPTAVWIVAIIAMAAIILFALLVILLICLYAIHSNYRVDIKYRVNGPLPLDDRLDIFLEPA